MRARAFHDSKSHLTFEPVAGAKNALNQLATKYILKIVTVRRRGIIEDTHTWLANNFPGIFTKNDISFIHFWEEGDNSTKAEICQQLGAKILIDDSIKHCTQAAEAGIEAILFGNNSWNQAKQLPRGVKRVAGWDEIVRILNV